MRRAWVLIALGYLLQWPRVPLWQLSDVQALPSVQVRALFAGFEQPPMLHTLSVQGWPSLHLLPSRT
jgi:hypothetical protein